MIADEDRIAAAKYDEALLNELIEENEHYILTCASNVIGKYLGKDSDEWSVALYAFVQSVKEYDPERGSFYAFSGLLIKRRMIEYLRKQSKFRREIPYSADAFDMEYRPDAEDGLSEYAKSQLITQEDTSLKNEIEALSEILDGYGFDFFDLINVSPKAGKTRKACSAAVSYLLQEPVLMSSLREQKNLPIKTIEKKCGLPRKLLERHRKYIITAAEILYGDYPMLSEYLHMIRKEMES